MDRRTPIVYAVTGQELELVRTDWNEGAVASMTAQVWRATQGNDETPILTPAVTVDTTSLQITGASGYSQTDRRKLTMSSTTGLTVGRIYSVENVDGQRELVRLARVVTNTEAYAETDLAYDYAAVATSLVKGVRASLTIDPTFVADEANLSLGPFRVLWSYTLGGLPRRHWTYFDVVRAKAQHGVQGDDLADLAPDIFGQEPRGQRGQRFARFIEAAWRQVQRELRDRSLDPNQVADADLDDLVRYCALQLVAESGRCPPGRDLETYVRERVAVYRRALEQAASSPQLEVAQNTDGSLTASPTIEPWFRS